MDSILMSIQPYHAYLELKGIKTLEVRKNSLSGKIFVYVSKNKKSFNRIPKEDREWFRQYLGNIAFEFICGGIMCEEALHMAHGLKDCCLTHEELDNYSKGRRIYGNRITALKVYDKPKELGEFLGLALIEKSWEDYKQNCGSTFTPLDEEQYKTGISKRYVLENIIQDCSIKKAPQSWQYCIPPKDLQ